MVKGRMMLGLASPGTSTRPSGQDVVAWLRETDSFADFALGLVESSGTVAHLAGGAVRDYFFCVPPQDIDVIVPNDDDRLLSTLGRMYPSRVNRHGNHRFFVADRTIDVIQPRCFYRPFSTAEETIAYFDMSVNALGVCLETGTLFDPWGGVEDIKAGRVHTVSPRWTEASDFECVHLMLRLLRYASRYELRLADPEAVLINLYRLDKVDWEEVTHYHAITKPQAAADLLRLAARE